VLIFLKVGRKKVGRKNGTADAVVRIMFGFAEAAAAENGYSKETKETP
jgi:hypothetical protein